MIEDNFSTVTVEGEISNWRPAASGHLYFTLKDRDAQLNIVMFRAQASRVNFRPKDGDAVRITGALSVYDQRGQLQMIAQSMEQVGLGALLAATRELKERLKREGLFNNQRPLPPFPRCIGVVTSLQGAALRDIVKVCRRRHAGVRLLIYPAAVQGPRCAVEVARGIRWFTKHPGHADVLLVARGGGSWEDLHGFDDEQVARAIAASAIPVITGIGHATDSVIADAAADVCAPTPSAAAELLTSAHHRIEDRLNKLEARLHRAGSYELLRARQRFTRVSAERLRDRLESSFNRRAQRLDELEFRAESAVRRLLRQRLERLNQMETRVRRRHPAVVHSERAHKVAAIETRLQRAAQMLLAQHRQGLDRATLRLEAMNPLRVLERGYALVYDTDGKLIRNATEVYSGRGIVARVSKGRIRARVEYTE
jgi:exodeoxyribonuclease VII large subunit